MSERTIPQLARANCSISRDDPGSPNSTTVLRAKSGRYVFSVPDAWSDDDVWRALEIYNAGIHAGFFDGVAHNQEEVKRVLGIRS